MSDEPPPLSLRLRPRATPTPAGNAEPEAAPLPSPVDPSAEGPSAAAPTVEDSNNDPFRLRLKPKSPPPQGLSAEVPMSLSDPPIQLPPAAEAAPEPPPLVAPELPPPKPIQSLPSPLRPPPVPMAAPRPLPPPIPPRAVTQPAAPLPKQSTPPPTIKADKWLAGIVILVVVLGGTVYGIRYLFNAHPKPKSVARAPSTTREEKPAATTAPKTAATPGSSQPHLVDNPQSSAGKAVARARDVVAAHDRREREEGVASVLDDNSEKPVTRPAAVPTTSSVQATTTTETRPAVVEESAAKQPEPPPPPSDAFRQFVVNMRVNGVFQGENARAMLNGRMYQVGDVVEPKLKISLFKVEPDAKQLVFRDETGAIISRRY